MFEKVKKFVRKVGKKAVCVGMAAMTAVSMLTVSAFAADGASSGGSTVIDSVTSTMQTELTNVASKAGVAIAAIIGVGLSIFAVKWLVGVMKSFFSKLAK